MQISKSQVSEDQSLLFLAVLGINFTCIKPWDKGSLRSESSYNLAPVIEVNKFDYIIPFIFN